MKKLLVLAALATGACGGGNYTIGPMTDRRPPVAVNASAPTADVDEKPPPALKRPRRPLPEPKETRLASGVRVLLLEDHDFPSASVGFVIDRGEAAAPPEVADLFAQAIRIGSTKNESSKETRGEMDWLGARLSTSATQDSVTLSVTSLGVLLPAAVTRSCALITTPTFDDDSLNVARTLAKRASLQLRADPSVTAQITVRGLLFPERHPYASVSSAGNPSRFTEMSKNELESFRDMYVALDRFTVVAAGDFKPEALLPRIEKCLASVPRKKAADAPPVPTPSTPSKARIVVVPRAGASQANIVMGFLGARRNDPDHAVLSVLESLLGRSLSGRLDLKIRGEHGYSYGVHVRRPSWREGGAIEIRTAAESAHAADTVKGVLAELERVKTEPIERAELARAKLNALANVIDTEDAASSGLALLRSLATSGRPVPLKYYEQVAARIESLTDADVQAAARKYFTTDSVQIAIVGDPSVADGLRALGVGDVTVRR